MPRMMATRKAGFEENPIRNQGLASAASWPRPMRWPLVLGLALAVLGCGTPTDERVRSEFLASYPGYRVDFAGVGEGDGGNAYFHIQYAKPGDDQVYEQVWLYLSGP